MFFFYGAIRNELKCYSIIFQFWLLDNILRFLIILCNLKTLIKFKLNIFRSGSSSWHDGAISNGFHIQKDPLLIPDISCCMLSIAAGGHSTTNQSGQCLGWNWKFKCTLTCFDLSMTFILNCGPMNKPPSWALVCRCCQGENVMWKKQWAQERGSSFCFYGFACSFLPSPLAVAIGTLSNTDHHSPVQQPRWYKEKPHAASALHASHWSCCTQLSNQVGRCEFVHWLLYRATNFPVLLPASFPLLIWAGTIKQVAPCCLGKWPGQLTLVTTEKLLFLVLLLFAAGQIPFQ